MSSQKSRNIGYYGLVFAVRRPNITVIWQFVRKMIRPTLLSSVFPVMHNIYKIK